MSEESDLEEGNVSQGGGKKKAKNEKRLQDADFSELEGGQVSESAEAATSESDTASKRELDEYREKYLRALAETENFKKRALKEKSDLLKYQGERIIHDFLPIVDNIELALQHSQGDSDKFRQGVELIYKQLLELLAKWDVKAESGIGKDFDPTKFSAISRVPVHDATPGTIINELKKAYFYKDKLLRPGEVVVADAVVEEDENEAQNDDEIEPEDES